ncbi:gamma-glutamylcyclotransferase family protein [Mucilaginibacter sp. dw_454]|uniref:gamma-glutamylcyclotransferase family protein n=1 Tax=Mucilaginibacter sp. dw_454 TaxID=2720079 RepID=UPI001BD5EC1F|nr:gamma-glutamylcyclotransferase family protein [Mucilaginibacter sp. dw_454]
MTNDLLFVYGTLLIADNEFARYLTGNSTFYCPGKIKGKLYDVGHYPALVIEEENNYDISGTVYRLHDADAVLKYLDPYEGYGEGEELPYLFVREALPIETEQGVILCWIYLYNRSVEGLYLIESGDYLDYLKTK